MKKRLLSAGLAGCILLGLTGCNEMTGAKIAQGNKKNAKIDKVLEVTNPKSVPLDNREKLDQFMSENKNEDKFMDGLNRFTANSMAAVLTTEKDNVAYSPLSLYFALAMAAEGADGETRKQMLDALQISDYSDTDLAKQIGKLYRKNYYTSDKQVCNIANSIWMDEGTTFEQAYIDSIRDDFYAELMVDDLSDENVWAAISQWISEKTNGMLNPEIQLGNGTIMAIINTIYFKGGFESEFDEKLTKEDIFTTENGEEQKADFMNQRFSESSYQKAENYVSYSMSFGGNGSIQFILPNEGVKVEELIKDGDSVQKLLSYKPENRANINFKLPKVDYETKMNLIPMLQSLGIEDAFEPNISNFLKLTKKNAVISDVIQGVRVKFEEKGVEAAAYTIIMDKCTAAMPAELPEVNIELNRPFMYAIKNAEGNVLFTGIIRGLK